jgi:hypothetical protein
MLCMIKKIMKKKYAIIMLRYLKIKLIKIINIYVFKNIDFPINEI